jgi:hypothetical protein
MLRALAREFPGALRELECLPLDALDRRLTAATAAAGGGELEDWMLWMIAYHRRMRIALAVKRKLTEGEPLATEAAAVARYVRMELREPCDVALVRRIARPPGGRLNRLVFELLEGELGRPGPELERALFPELTSKRAARELGRE